MDYPTSCQINENGHVFMSLADTELVNAKILDIVDWNTAIHTLQLHLVNGFDQIPSYTHIFCHILDSTNLEQIEYLNGKRPDK